MKYLFLCVFTLLGLASFANWQMQPDSNYDGITLYWMTDRNPAREEQVAIFQRWLTNHPNRHQNIRVLVDTANSSKHKKVIQGVSGVAGDVIDMFGGTDLRYFYGIGMLEPVTQAAKEMGYSTDATWEAIRPLLNIPVMQDDGTYKNEQYLSPCSASMRILWVDYNQFDELGVQRPPHRWNWNTFEKIGKEFVRKANSSHRRVKRFMVHDVDVETLYRSLGLAKFNETLTRCQLDDSRYVKALEKKYQWMNVDHIMPTATEQSGFDVESGYGGARLFLFAQGNYAMFEMGRYALIRLREIQQSRLDQGQPLMNLDVVEPPHDGFPTALCHTRAVGVYAGGKYIDQAKVFQSYLASEDYNMQIVRDADAMPPNPKYVTTLAWDKPLPLLPHGTEKLFPYQSHEIALFREFRIDFYNAIDHIDRQSNWTMQDLPRPPKPQSMTDAAYQEAISEFDRRYLASIPVYQAEWGMHDRFTFIMNHVALPLDVTPYCVPEIASREITNAEDAFFNDLLTANEAAARAAQRVNDEIQRTLQENPELQVQYQKALLDQKRIDDIKQAGRKIPARLIQNPFYLRYYKDKRMLADE